LDDFTPVLLDGIPILVDSIPCLTNGIPILVDGIPCVVDGIPMLLCAYRKEPQTPNPQTLKLGVLTRDIEDVVVYYCGEREGEKIPPPTGSTSAVTTTPSVSRQVRVQSFYG
jgi:hypothetical protein